MLSVGARSRAIENSHAWGIGPNEKVLSSHPVLEKQALARESHEICGCGVRRAIRVHCKVGGRTRRPAFQQSVGATRDEATVRQLGYTDDCRPMPQGLGTTAAFKILDCSVIARDDPGLRQRVVSEMVDH